MRKRQLKTVTYLASLSVTDTALIGLVYIDATQQLNFELNTYLKSWTYSTI